MPREISGDCKKPLLAGNINELKTKHSKIVHQKLSSSSDEALAWPFLELRSQNQFEKIEFLSEKIQGKDDQTLLFPCFEFYCDGEKCDFSLAMDGEKEYATEICRRLEIELHKLKSKKVGGKKKSSGKKSAYSVKKRETP